MYAPFVTDDLCMYANTQSSHEYSFVLPVQESDYLHHVYHLYDSEGSESEAEEEKERRERLVRLHSKLQSVHPLYPVGCTHGTCTWGTHCVIG